MQNVFFSSWDSFPLFQILNDYLRTDGEETTHKFSYNLQLKYFTTFQTDNLKNGKFHQHLRDTFAPQVNFRLVSPISPQNCQYNIEFFFKIGYPVRWPDGELHRAVHPQGIREGKVGNQGVSEKSESNSYVGISGRRTGTNQNSGVCGEICRKVPRPCRGKPRYQKCFP